MIVCLHGFLGKGSDWDPFVADFQRASGTQVFAPDLFTSRIRESIPEWADRFAATLSESDAPHVIIGYSLGGRLGLHTVVRNPDVVRGAVIISAGPGMDASSRTQRLETDLSWARRFETDPWPDLMKAWNSQTVFSGDRFRFERKEEDFRRDALAEAIRRWSPARYESLEPHLPELDFPILWIAGERDRKYRNEAERAASLCPQGTSWIAPDAGHRVPWELPEEFSERVSHFLEGVFSR